MAVERIYATGRRKNATARVWISPGTGEFTVNGKPIDEYFGRETLVMSARQPFDITETSGQFDVYTTVSGGGISGQAGAIRHGIARGPFPSSTWNGTGPSSVRRLPHQGPREWSSARSRLHKARKRPQFSKR